MSIGGNKIKELIARKKRGQKGTAQALHTEPPFGGINASVPMSQMPPSDCVFAFNLFPARYGMRARPGYMKWCPPIPLGDGIKTIIPCNASLRGNTQDRLFAATSDGIYEITVFQAAPVKRQDFTIKTTDAGWCSWHNFTNTAGAQYILICDLVNGYYIYDVTANTFTQPVQGTAPGEIEGANPADFAHVAIWKNRIWFSLRNSTRAFYLNTVGTITGKTTAFDFGSKFKYGGFLKGIWNWTSDGGAGIDDHLVAISSMGDVCVYTGWDPTTASGEGAFQMRGVWYLGNTPRGRRFVLEEGGDLLIYTAEGLLSLSQLTSGLAVEEERVFYMTAKINSLLRFSFREKENLFGYELNSLPRYSAVILATPKVEGQRDLQWLYSYETKGWFLMRGLPINTVENWGTRVFFGDTDNTIWELAGVADRVEYDVENSGTPVEFSMLTSYQGYGNPANLKRVHLLRPYWVGGSIPQYGVEARFDFVIDEQGTVPPFFPQIGAFWDLSSWDDSVWGGGYQTQQLPYGGVGMGRYVAIALRGNSYGTAAYMGCDIVLDQGGFL